jgi:hypothetical protein
VEPCRIACSTVTGRPASDSRVTATHGSHATTRSRCCTAPWASALYSYCRILRVFSRLRIDLTDECASNCGTSALQPHLAFPAVVHIPLERPHSRRHEAVKTPLSLLALSYNYEQTRTSPLEYSEAPLARPRNCAIIFTDTKKSLHSKSTSVCARQVWVALDKRQQFCVRQIISAPI